MTDPTSIQAISIEVRPAAQRDAPALCVILNEIIHQGGTTALQQPLSVATFDDYFISGPDVIACAVAQDAGTDMLLGFQALSRDAELPAGWADIATFARLMPKVPGIGTALFAATLASARELKLLAINATIRADNASGLGYYTKLGFEDYAVAQGIRLLDGTPVDRLSKRYLLG